MAVLEEEDAILEKKDPIERLYIPGNIRAEKASRGCFLIYKRVW
jgi:hypothetical protein